MKLAAIYNVWDGCELLEASMRSVANGIDLFIIVYQDRSNFFELYSPIHEITNILNIIHPWKESLICKYTPDFAIGQLNEIQKRNLGLQIAIKNNCTHFLFLDVDECYENFEGAKQEYCASRKAGSVCKLFTYFKLPTLRFETFDNYYVPFIHSLHSETIAGNGKYPYYVDPTRKIDCSDVALISEPMHHFSYVRKDIERKCRNSSARANIEKSQLLQDYYNPECGPGFFVTDFKQKLIDVPNIFNIEI